MDTTQKELHRRDRALVRSPPDQSGRFSGSLLSSRKAPTRTILTGYFPPSPTGSAFFPWHPGVTDPSQRLRRSEITFPQVSTAGRTLEGLIRGLTRCPNSSSKIMFYSLMVQGEWVPYSRPASYRVIRLLGRKHTTPRY